MDDFREEIQRRRYERRQQRSNSWINFILKIIFFIFVVLMIRFFANPTKKNQPAEEPSGMRINQIMKSDLC
ncbi:MAG: hypothetical protein JW996_02470 [Candidatus Cloacimonetes bacterium]|nr:hypothetical protein [Candidatus Cloacimonadota bacterium]